MAGGDAEEKKIAKLNFDVSMASKSLDEINNKLKKIAEESEKYSKTIGKNLNNSFDASKMIDTTKVEQKFKTISGYTTEFGKKMKYTLSGNVDFSKMIDVNKFKKDFDNLESIGKTGVKKVATTIMSESTKTAENRKRNMDDVQAHQSKVNTNMLRDEAKHADKMAEIDAWKNAKIEVQNNKTANQQILNNERVAKSTESLYDKVTQYAKTYIIYQGFNELRKGITETIQEMTDVQYRMVEIDRVLNESSLDIDHYRDKLIQLAYDYGNSFDNVSDITLRLAKAGLDSQEALALTEKTLLALNTAELDATQATDDMVAVMAQWNLLTGTATEQAKSYGDIIDKVNKVADNFPTTSEDILEALKKTSSAFNLAGASIDETIAMIVAAEKASQRGGKVIGTALSNIVQQLKAEGKINIMESLGIDVYKDATKSDFNSIIDIIGQLSSKMQELKDSGKESSAEMQNLLEVFTVFRRNIGASLLSEMEGEESTYQQVLDTMSNAIGYSLQENEKHMKTAQAAQAQFNAELLKLKTSVWDNGLEDVFRSMLLLGSDIAKVFKTLIDTFGALPTAIGAATLAFTAFNKQFKTFQVTYTSSEGFKIDNSFFDKIKKAEGDVRALQLTMNGVKVTGHEYSETFKQYVNNIGNASVSTQGYISYLVKQKAATIAAQAATIALNAALSIGLSAAVTVAIGAIDNLIHAEEKAAQKAQERTNSSKDLFDTYEKERTSIDELIKEYEELGQKKSRTPEEELRIYAIQSEINGLIKDQKESIDLVNGAYDESIAKLKEISKQERERSLKQAEITMKSARQQAEDYGDFKLGQFIDPTLKNANFEDSIRLLEEFKKNLEDADDTSSDLYKNIIEDLQTMYEMQESVNESTKTYNELLAESKMEELFPEGSIQTVEDFNNALDQINYMDFSGMEELREILTELVEEQYPEFIDMSKAAKDELEDATGVIDATLTSLQNLTDQFSILQAAQDEYNSTGQLTAQTFQSLINNDLLQYLSIQDGQLLINAQSMLDLAEAKKIEAIEALQSAASNDIEKVAMGDVNSISGVAKGAIAGMGSSAAEAGNKMQTAAAKASALAQELRELVKATNPGSGVDAGTFAAQADAIRKAYEGIANTIASIDISAPTYSPQSVGGGRSGGGGSSSSAAQAAREAERAAEQAAREAEQAAKEAQKAAEEEYKRKLDLLKNFVKERERLEKRWVDNQKQLGLLSNEDFMYITQQRIERYEEYLEQVKNATWLSDEDRLELEKEYSEKIEDLQVDYLDYYKEKLDDEIDALEKANDEKIKTIKNEAKERINALRKVEDENDRIRRKEEYEKNRLKHLEDISYWEQRTGREAQQALKEARKNLKELDEQWEQQMEDWSIEDQIQAIEDERDAQIQAIEDAQEAEIQAMKDMYNEKLQLFAETGKIIYDSTKLQSEALYSQYKSRFIDPLKQDLLNLNNALNPVVSTPTQSAPAQSSAPDYIEYTVDPGDSLWKIAQDIYGDGSLWTKIYDENEDVIGGNPGLIYPGQVFQIPQFHQGGIFNPDEGLAILKRNEMILKPEWTDSMVKLMKYFDNVTAGGDNPMAGNVIQIDGNLVNIQADIKSEGDMNRLTRKIEKVLTDKFNIKK